MAYFLVNRRMRPSEQAAQATSWRAPWWLAASLMAASVAALVYAQFALQALRGRESGPLGWTAFTEWIMLRLNIEQGERTLRELLMFHLSFSLWFYIILLAAAIYILGALASTVYHRRRGIEARLQPGHGLDWVVTSLILLAVLAPFLLGEIPPLRTIGNLILIPTLPIFFGLAAIFLVAYYLVHGRAADGAPPEISAEAPTLERWGVYMGLLLGLGLSIKNGTRGFANIYWESRPEAEWGRLFWNGISPALLAILIAVSLWLLIQPLPRRFRQDPIPHAYALVWLVLIVQNILAQLITGPLTNWHETIFNIYYLMLFLFTAAILHHYHVLKRHLYAAGEVSPVEAVYEPIFMEEPPQPLDRPYESMF